MKTDVQLCKLFESNPRYLGDLLNFEDADDYEVVGEVFKDIERRADLVWRSDKHSDLAVIEIQGYEDPLVCHRGELMRVMLSMKDISRTVRLVVVYLDPCFDPKTEPWHTYTRTGNPLYSVVYLNEALAQLEAKSPDHLLVKTLAPIYMDDNDQLAAKFQDNLHKLNDSNLPEGEKRDLIAIFLSLFTSRFGIETAQELKAMLAPLMDFKDTGVYKEVFAEGKIEGKTEGKVEGEIEILHLWLDDVTKSFETGQLTEEAYRKKREAIELKLAEKQAALKAASGSSES